MGETTMNGAYSSKFYNALLAYALSASLAKDPLAFRRLVGLRGQLGGITAACFLLYRTADETEACVHHFLFRTAPVLLQQLIRTTQPQRVVMHGRTRGRVDWPGTYKVRYSEDTNPTVFVCLPSWRDFDRPENQLFLFMLHHIQVCLEQVPRSLMDWQAWGSALMSERNAPLHVGNYVATLAHRVRTYRSHIYLREVELPALIGEHHLLAARTAKNNAYRNLADLYQGYQDLVHLPNWDRWTKMLQETLPLPPDAEEIGRILSVN
jgi:hypothetical protein